MHVGHPTGPHDGLDLHLRHRLSAKSHADAGMILMPGHSRGLVVQDDDGALPPIVDDVEQGGDARVEEGGVPDDSHKTIGDAGHVKAVGHAYAGPHGPHRICGIERGKRA